MPERRIDRKALAQRRLLQIGVARRGDSGFRERDLNEARAIDPEARFAAPEIRAADEAFRDRDEIRCLSRERAEMRREDEAAAGELHEIAAPPATATRAPRVRVPRSAASYSRRDR